MRSHLARAAALLVLLALAGRPATAVELDEAGLGATQEGRGGVWSLSASIVGSSDISSAILTLPDKASTVQPLACDSLPGFVECSVPDEDAGPFVSLGALLTAFPVGVYFLSINGGERTASLPFDPTEPDGFLTLTFPGNGDTHVSATTPVGYENTCSNCTSLGFVLDGGPSTSDFLYETTDLSSPGSILYADWQAESKPPQLPNGLYLLFGAAAVTQVSTQSFDQGIGPVFEFQYATGAGQGTAITFTVPEPASVASVASSLLALVALAATRRGRCGRSRGF